MNELIQTEQTIQKAIFTVRGKQVMLDKDLAELYHIETKVFNQAVKRNIKRFPESFRFQLTKIELENLRSQIVTFKENLNTKYLPYVFTEQGVSMLSAILKSDVAIDISIKIIESFVSMRKIITSNSLMFERFERIEQKLSLHDKNFDEIFNAIEDKSIKPSQGIFYDGKTFDAYVFVADLIKSAKISIKLIDNYIDETVLTLFSKNENIKLDLEKYNFQYNNIEIKKFDISHDRFLIIDEKEVYHIGASLKDLGKKWFGFSKMENESFEMMGRLG